ncbi:VOC family protein [Natronoglycomyces albus]|uniref:VOC family protein n=1 Tax=Natronoglycomyces albus TaxID=2811108 RepID=A0A895XN04_9ACTN|nr:VOC family protein [Natronoglycomyces albus]QSB04779.1 VOC family protein [Natronoglycomyces albus]
MSFQAVTPFINYGDIQAATSWLTEKLGFGDVRFYREEDGSIGYADIYAGATRMLLTAAEPEPGNGQGSLFIVHVDDVDALYESVKANGVEADPPRDTDYGPRTFGVTDPWGYSWYFWQGDTLPE